ncbi:MAG: hypothetical protein ACK5MQ_11900, partial [Pikeienuella sp.]
AALAALAARHGAPRLRVLTPGETPTETPDAIFLGAPDEAALAAARGAPRLVVLTRAEGPRPAALEQPPAILTAAGEAYALWRLAGGGNMIRP